VTRRSLELVSASALAAIVSLGTATIRAQAPTPPAKPADAAQVDPVLKTSWGEPDLQGLWTSESATPLQRPAKYAGREFLTDAEIAELDRQRARDQKDAKPGDLLTHPLRVDGRLRDATTANDADAVSARRPGRRTSLIVDPPDGKVPPLTPEAQKTRAMMREFQLALLQATETCKNKTGRSPTDGCAEGQYGPPSPRRKEPPPYYNTERLNRADGPEDRSLGERCMGALLPDFDGFRTIVQSPGVVSIYYDTGQGQGWHRVIPVDDNPHLPSSVAQWWGDSRGHWDGNTLVVDVTNFSPQTDYRGSREHLHLIERWTRTGPATLDLVVTIEDATTWTKPWTVVQELNKQGEQADRSYKEPRCHEGNVGLLGILANMRAADKAFAEGRGPDPATEDNASNLNLGEECDPSH
jgi:hypothetical protein